MKIVYIIPFYKRLDLTDLCFSELKKQGREIYSVGSEGEKSQKIALKNGVNYIEFSNFPVSEKHNALTGSLRSVDFDYAVLVGSDNFVSGNFSEKLEEYLKLEKPDFTQFDSIYFHNQKTKKTTYLKCPTGVGRCFSKRLLEKMDYKLWEHGMNSGLDGSSAKNLKKKGYIPTIISLEKLGVEMVDVKYASNITSHGVVNRGKIKDLKLIDLSEINNLSNYSDTTLRKRNVLLFDVNKNRVKILNKETGKVKMFNKSISSQLLKNSNYVKV
jgi:hypothetical protein